MSLGYGDVQALRDAVEASIASGLTYVAAAGNGHHYTGTYTNALAAAGDRAAAVQHGRIHQSRVQDQLGVPPDPAVQALVQRLQEALPAMRSVQPHKSRAGPARPA